MFYYGALIVYGAFFIVNMVLSVIRDSFNELVNKERIAKNKERFLEHQKELEEQAEADSDISAQSLQQV